MELPLPSTQKKKRSGPVVLLSGLFLLVCAGVGYWFLQSMASLVETRLVLPTTQLASSFGGTVAQVLVQPGQIVQNGTHLFTLDPKEFEEQYAVTVNELGVIASSLSPEILQQYQHPDSIPTLQTLSALIEARRVQENSARKAMEAASTAQAQAAYAANKAQTQFDKKKLSKEDLEKTKNSRNVAEQTFTKAKEQFETISLKRAELETKLQGLRTAFEQAGLTNLSVFMRTKAYEGQLATVREAQKALQATKVQAEQAGRITAVFIKPGQVLQPGQATLGLALTEPEVVRLVAFAAPGTENSIKTGQTCHIYIPLLGSFTGTIAGTEFVAAQSGNTKEANSVQNDKRMQVHIRLTSPINREALLALPEDTKITTTVAL